MKTNRKVRLAGKWRDPFELTNGGVMVTGTTGSGKSSLIDPLVFDACHRMDRIIRLNLDGDEHRNALEWAALKTPGMRVVRFDPSYTDGVGFDFPAMIRTESDRQYMAAKLLPTQKGDHQPHFILSAQELFLKALNVIDHFGSKKWELADPIRLVFHEELFTFLGKKVPTVGNPFASIGSEDGTADVIATIRTRLGQLKIIAALLLHAKEKINPLDFDGALDLRWRDRERFAFAALYAFLFDLVTDRRLEAPRDDILWLFLDEYRQLDVLDCIGTIARRGRKCGIIPVTSVHEIEGIYDRYGRERGEESLALVGHKIFLKIGGVNTAKWGSEYLGNVDSIVDVLPPQDGKQTSRVNRDRLNVTPDELRRLPRPNARTDTIVGYYDGPDETYKFETPWLTDVTPPTGWKPKPRTRHPAKCEIMPKFTADDFTRLNFPTDDPQLMRLLK